MLAPSVLGTPKNQTPGISSLNGELGSDAPMAMASMAANPSRAGRRTSPLGWAPGSGPTPSAPSVPVPSQRFRSHALTPSTAWRPAAPTSPASDRNPPVEGPGA